MAEKGACRISFSAQNFGLEKFGNYKTSTYQASAVSPIYCVRDFLRIPDGSPMGFLHAPTHDRYCGGHLNPEHNSLQHQPIIAPILGSLFTLDVRTGAPNFLPTTNSAGLPLNPEYVEAHHTPGFSIEFKQLSGESCPYADLSLIGQ